MIFVSVGTQKQSFHRLLQYLEEIDIKEEIIAQIGNSNFKSNKIKTFKYLDSNEMNKYIKKANIVITHGGGGTIFQALTLNKKVIVVPRKKAYKEHINDHQMEISTYLKNENLVSVCNTKEELEMELKTINHKQFEKYSSNQDTFVEIINKEIKIVLEQFDKS